MAFSYDLSTPIGKTRLYIPDKDEQAAVFSDEEIRIFLAENGGNHMLAAAAALEVVASDPQRLQQMARGGISETYTEPSYLMTRAASLRTQAQATPYGTMVVGRRKRGDFYDD